MLDISWEHFGQFIRVSSFLGRRLQAVQAEIALIPHDDHIRIAALRFQAFAFMASHAIDVGLLHFVANGAMA